MSDQRQITTLPQSAYSIKEAAVLIGKSDITLVRWCRDGVFANAGKVPGPKGDEWSIPADDLARVIESKGLKIDLRDKTGQDQSDDRATDGSHHEMIELLKENAELREKTGHLTGQNDQLAERVKKLGDDVDHAQSEWHRAATDRDKALGQVEALHTQLEDVQKAAKDEVAKRVSLDLEHRELQKTSAESISDLSTKLNGAQNETETAVGERNELAKKLAEAEASMGWWTRRKYNKD